MDLLLNLICSVKKIPTVNLKDFIIFVGHKDYIPLIETLGWCIFIMINIFIDNEF
jgi:hypothetical protein